MTNHELAHAAVKACMDDLRLRSGFRELIAQIPDWTTIEGVVVSKVEQRLDAANPGNKPAQETLDFG